MTANAELKMPAHFASIEAEEMVYLDGGADAASGLENFLDTLTKVGKVFSYLSRIFSSASSLINNVNTLYTSISTLNKYIDSAF